MRQRVIRTPSSNIPVVLSRRVLALLPPAAVLLGCWLALWLGHNTFTQPWPFQALCAVAFASYCWAVVTALQLANLQPRLQAAIVLGGALLFHLVLVPAPYAFSDDIFRYIWNGRVSAAGIDPYRYPPGDPALAALRDESIWPYVNAKEQPSPYPPLLESLFALVYRLLPESLPAMKAAMSAFNLGVIGILLMLLHRQGQPPILALIYAWNPQTAFQVGFSGHNEPLMLFWLLLGLLLGQPARQASQTSMEPHNRGIKVQPYGGPAVPSVTDHASRPATRMYYLAAAWCLALATLSKIVPLLVFPILWRRWGWQAAAAYLATLGVVYAALLLRGQQVFNGLFYEASTAQFNDGAYYLLYRLFRDLWPGDPHLPARLAAGAIFGLVLLALLWRRGSDLTAPLGVILATYVILTPSVAPWYALWILPFVTLDVLPQPWRRTPQRTAFYLLASYWLIFSWTANFSELFYFVSSDVWTIAHTLAYMLPLGALLLAFARSRHVKGPW